MAQVFCVSANAPEYLSYKVISGNQVDFRFSMPVAVRSAQFEPDAAWRNRIDIFFKLFSY